jgi:transposase-like protein
VAEHPFPTLGGVRSADDVREVIRLSDAGHSRAEIARRVGVARSTVRRWLDGAPSDLLASRERTSQTGLIDGLDELAYAYLLGQYLGDGSIDLVRSTFRLRITCCDSYPAIVRECVEALSRVKPGAKVSLQRREGCTDVCSYWLQWPRLLPHGDGGPKHRRTIALADWQRLVAIDRYPQQFLRGLIHSDGWRGLNRVRGANGQSYAYTRYQFSNRSDDIKQLFIDACDRLGIETRRMNAVTISVATRRGVERLDAFVGPKR